MESTPVPLDITDDWTKELWHGPPVERHSAYEKMRFAATWTDPETIRLSEVSQTEETQTT